MLNRLINEYAFVAKVEVSNIEASVEWYSSKLGLEIDPQYPTGKWRQMLLPGVPNVSIGLWQSKAPSSSGGAVSTFVVGNLELNRNELLQNGVEVSPIQDAGEGVLLCYFRDLDGNQLGLRQNS